MRLDRERFNDALKHLTDGVYWLQIGTKRPTRSNEQNSYYWGVLIEQATAAINEANGEHYTPDNIHDYFKHKFNPVQVGGVVIGGSTKDMDSKEFEAYQEKIRKLIFDFQIL